MKNRAERDPVELQLELLSIDEQIEDLMPALETKNKTYQEAKAAFEVDKMRLKLLKERRSTLQSVLKSLTVV